MAEEKRLLEESSSDDEDVKEPDSVGAMLKLGKFFFEQNHFREALPIFQKVYEARLNSFGQNHELTLEIKEWFDVTTARIKSSVKDRKKDVALSPLQLQLAQVAEKKRKQQAEDALLKMETAMAVAALYRDGRDRSDSGESSWEKSSAGTMTPKDGTPVGGLRKRLV